MHQEGLTKGTKNMCHVNTNKSTYHRCLLSTTDREVSEATKTSTFIWPFFLSLIATDNDVIVVVVIKYFFFKFIHIFISILVPLRKIMFQCVILKV